jgi:hypothetical protein
LNVKEEPPHKPDQEMIWNFLPAFDDVNTSEPTVTSII